MGTEDAGYSAFDHGFLVVVSLLMPAWIVAVALS